MKLSDLNETTQSQIARRAYQMARLILTRPKGVTVIDGGVKSDAGVDLVVHINEPAHPSGIIPVFGVQVKGTAQPLPDEKAANKYVASYWREWHSEGSYLFPIVLMLFSVEDDTGYFGWIMRPDVPDDGDPTLVKSNVPLLAKIQHGVMSTVFSRVYKWYGRMAKKVVAESADK
jgi:hypothetical protein